MALCCGDAVIIVVFGALMKYWNRGNTS